MPELPRIRRKIDTQIMEMAAENMVNSTCLHCWQAQQFKI